MATTNFYSVSGILLGEKTTGGNRMDYLSDALGSVTATVNPSAQGVNTYRYKPYGTQLAKTGAGSDPSFTWIGQWGYRQTGRRFSDVYVRVRSYANILATWITKDLLLNELPFCYAKSNPVCYSDPSGLRVDIAEKFRWPKVGEGCNTLGMPPKLRGQITNAIDGLCSTLGDPISEAPFLFQQCIKNCGVENISDPISCFEKWCDSGQDIFCRDEEDKGCKRNPKFTIKGCIRKKPCPPHEEITETITTPPCAYVDGRTCNKITFCSWWWTDLPTECPNQTETGRHCGTVPNAKPYPLPGSSGVTLVHEILHICAKCKRQGDPDDPLAHSLPYNCAARCILKLSGIPDVTTY